MPAIPSPAHDIFRTAAFRPPSSVQYPATETQQYPYKDLLTAHHKGMYIVPLAPLHGDTPTSLSRTSRHNPATVALIMQHRNRAFGYRVGYFGSRRRCRDRHTPSDQSGRQAAGATRSGHPHLGLHGTLGHHDRETPQLSRPVEMPGSYLPAELQEVRGRRSRCTRFA